MKKKFSIFIFIIVVIISYFVISNLLFRINETPRWYQIKHPEAVAANKPFEITIKYHDVNYGCRLNAVLVFTDMQGQYRGEKKAQNPMRIIHGTGEVRFSFLISDNELYNKDIFSVRINLAKFELPKGGASSFNTGKRIGETVNSGSIPLVKINPDGSFPEVIKPSFSQILKKAVNEGKWVESAGDNTALGWVITVSYFIVCFLCLLYLKNLRKNPVHIDKVYIRFWYFIVILIFILGINKQLDVQMLLADIGRTYTTVYGWYNTRKPFQIKFISFFASLAAGFIVLSGYALRKIRRRVLLPILGMCILFSFVIIKASPLHKIENIFHNKIPANVFFGLFELIGLTCIGLSTVIDFQKSKSGINKSASGNGINY